MARKKLSKKQVQRAVNKGVAQAKRFQPGGAAGLTRRLGASVARKAVTPARVAQANRSLKAINKVATRGKKGLRKRATKAFNKFF